MKNRIPIGEWIIDHIGHFMLLGCIGSLIFTIAKWTVILHFVKKLW